MTGQSKFLCKTLVFGVIILFICVGIQPAIATVEPENIDTEYFDVTTEFIGLNKEYTTRLTKEEIEELDALFDDVYERLNLSTSIKESVEIFKDAVVKLNNLGLLGDVGIQETEKLVSNYYQNPRLLKMLESENNIKGPNDGTMNTFCLIAGRVEDPLFYHLIFLTTIFSFGILLGYPWSFTFLLILMGYIFFRMINPFCLAQAVLLIDDYGTIISFGLMGLKYWQGGLDGMIGHRLFISLGPGIIGFTGLKIQSFEQPTYFLGGALLAYIEDSS